MMDAMDWNDPELLWRVLEIALVRRDLVLMKRIIEQIESLNQPIREKCN